jgi:hypothetical protein
MALVTLAYAKAHLRIPADDNAHNDDVSIKAEQASAIILDYLKSRINNRSTIVSSSVASPTLITTLAAHTYLNGNTVTITGHAGSTPDLNGSWTISNVTSTTFTIPVAVTVAGTGGTASVSWTYVTVPVHVQAAVLLMLTHLYEHRGDDQKADADVWLAIERLLIRSRDPAFA